MVVVKRVLLSFLLLLLGGVKTQNQHKVRNMLWWCDGLFDAKSS